MARKIRSNMSVAKRTADAESQISTARSMPSSWKSGTNSTGDAPGCEAAEAKPESHPGAPTKLPGYGK